MFDALNLNEKGNFIFIALGLMVALIFLLPVLMYVFPPIDIIVKVLLIFVLFSTVRGYLGNGVLTYIVTGILIYILVIKWWWIGATGWFALTLAGFGIFSIITWGSKTVIDLTKPKR
jgi:hypothetical protein